MGPPPSTQANTHFDALHVIFASQSAAASLAKERPTLVFARFLQAGCSLSVVYGTMPPEALAASTERGADRAKVRARSLHSIQP